MSRISGSLAPQDYANVLMEIKERVRIAQYEALRAVNRELVSLYWDIGRIIVEQQKNETWGKSVVETLAHDLQTEFPGMSGFSAQNLWRMRQFYEQYGANEKLSPLVREIGWSQNLIILMRCEDDLEREFYLRMTHKHRWTKVALQNHIQADSYRRYLTNQTNFDQTLSTEMRQKAKLAVKDEYIFGFLDLLLYHRRLKCLVAIELKIGEFIPEYVGKMQFYLAVLDDLVREEGENPSIGIILSKSKERTIVEYALRESNKPIGVATYQTIDSLPARYRHELPAPEQVAMLLEGV